MNVSGLGSFSLDGVTYRFEALNPLEAMRFGNRVFKVFAALLGVREKGRRGNGGGGRACVPCARAFRDG